MSVRKLGKGGLSIILFLVLTLSSASILGLNQVRAQDFSSNSQMPTGVTDLPADPSVAHDSLGRIWVVYANKTVGSFTAPDTDIFFKTLNVSTSSWSKPIRVTNDPLGEVDTSPFIAALSNGSMMITWSSNRTGANRYQLFYKLYSGATSTIKATSNINRLTVSALNDTEPSVVQDRNGRIWVAWSRQNQTSTPSGSVFYGDIYYKYFNGSAWSVDFPLPGASNIIVGGLHQDQRSPSLTQTIDGRIWVMWASNQTSTGYLDLFDTTTNGALYTLPSSGIASSAWSPRRDFTNDTSADNQHPIITQARNGTIMVFWDRCSGNLCLTAIYYKASNNNGATWNCPVPGCSLEVSTTIDQRSPAAAQMLDKKVWLFWQTSVAQGTLCGTGTTTPCTSILYSSTAPITNIANVGLKGLALSSSFLRSGVQWDNSGATNITVTVQNSGDFTENTTLTVELNSTIIIATPVINLLSGQTRNIQFTFQTVLGFWGRYIIAASLQPVPGESLVLQGDNNWTGGLVRVSAPGDVDYNGCVNILDAALLAFSYGSTPGTPLWNPGADVAHEGVIDIVDAAYLATYYGACV